VVAMEWIAECVREGGSEAEAEEEKEEEAVELKFELAFDGWARKLDEVNSSKGGKLMGGGLCITARISGDEGVQGSRREEMEGRRMTWGGCEATPV